MEELRKKYTAQADLIGSKPRFGFFSIPPSHTAGITDFKPKPCRKGSDGRVTTDMRNVFSGNTSSGILKKTFFSVPKSIYEGDPYQKGKDLVKDGHKTVSNKDGQKQIFKPAKLNKTLSTPAYKYQCENPPPKDPKANRREDGSVTTKDRNICANPLSKMQQQKMKKFKYSESPFGNEHQLRNKQLQQSIKKRRGEGPFKSGSPIKDFFSSNIQAFNDHEIKKSKAKYELNYKIVVHEGAFKPSCKPLQKCFSYPEHQSDYDPNKLKKKVPATGDPFRLSNKPCSSKPCPSIAYSRINVMRNMR